jgi:hypothetical protein
MKRAKLKTISTILLNTLLLLVGCDNSPDLLVNSADNNPQATLSKTIDYDIIPLPPKSPLWIDSILTMSQIVNGDVGDRMIMEKYYIAVNGDSIGIKADLRIPAGAFTGKETITITVDNEYAIIHFSPSMVFQDTLRLFQSFIGLDLNNFNTGTIDFVFIHDDGNIELIKNNGLQINVPQGIVRVQNAKLLHFSRYGWIRKTVGPISLPGPLFD